MPRLTPRTPPRARFALLLACLLLVGWAGCGAEEEPEAPTEVERPEPGAEEEVQVETTDDPARIPGSWTELINREAGFSIGIPPGWTESPLDGAAGSMLRSPDDLAAITITADRSRGAQELPLREFARRTAEALGSDIIGSERFRDLEIFAPGEFGHRYDARAIRALGTPEGTDVRERVLVVVVRREGLATYVVVVRENDERESELADRDTVKEIIRSLRGRPPE